MKKIKLSTGAEVEMREPKVRDIKLVNNIKDEFDKEMALLSNLTEMTQEELENLTMQDFSKLDEALQVFLS